MNVKVYMKTGETYEYKETAIFDDAEAGRLVLAYGKLKGCRTNLSGRLARHYMFNEIDHLSYRWCDVKKVEITH